MSGLNSVLCPGVCMPLTPVCLSSMATFHFFYTNSLTTMSMDVKSSSGKWGLGKRSFGQLLHGGTE